jgi:hypothetical protein
VIIPGRGLESVVGGLFCDLGEGGGGEGEKFREDGEERKRIRVGGMRREEANKKKQAHTN